MSRSTAASSQIRLVTAAVLLVYLGQMTLAPIIAPLAREVELAEWRIGIVISSAALCIVVLSQRWGRLSQSWGRKPVLVAAMAVATAATGAFALVAHAGIEGALRGEGLFVLLVLVRGALFGAAMAAVLPTAQAYVADVTESEGARLKGMAGLGAAQGVAMILGSLLGGVLAGAGILVPMTAVPVILLLGTLMVAAALRPERRQVLVEKPPRVSPRDPRVLPFLLVGFGLFTALGFIQVITGFIIQDRFGLDAAAAAAMTGAALLAAGVGMVLAQAVVVPRSGWGPVLLMRAGAVVALAGFALFVPSWSVAVAIAAVFLIGSGIGLALPGYSAGPSLAVEAREQGGVAGLLGANTALTFVLAPSAATVLYGWRAEAPIVAGGVAMVGVVVLLWLHPRFRAPAALRSDRVRRSAEGGAVPSE